MENKFVKPWVGVVGIGLYLPSGRMSAKQISEATQGFWSEEAIISKLGIVEKVIPGENDGTQAMGLLAALGCLQSTNTHPDEIDVVLSIGEEWKEYPLSTTSIAIINGIKAKNAWGIDLQNRCSSLLSAIKIAKDMLLADDDITTILIAGGYRNGDFVDYKNKDLSMFYDLGAGGGAILLKKNYPYNQVLSTHIIADASLQDHIRIDVGGMTNPISSDNLDYAYHSMKMIDAPKFKSHLESVSFLNWLACIDAVLNKESLTREAIDFIALPHIRPIKHETFLKQLSKTPNQSIYLNHYGHIGQLDSLLSLKFALEDSLIKDNSLICLCAAGMGFVWASTLIRWGSVR